MLGLVGGIGSGKSAAAIIFSTLGAGVIDLDLQAHEELLDPAIVTMLKQWWGPCVLWPDGSVNRRAVADIVFERPSELVRLEGILYPRIERRLVERMAGLDSDAGVLAIVIDAPKLFEAGLDRLCDAIVYVDADWEVRIARVGSSRGWNVSELERRESRQKPLDNKRGQADHIVDNNSGLEVLRSGVERVFATVLAAFHQARSDSVSQQVN